MQDAASERRQSGITSAAGPVRDVLALQRAGTLVPGAEQASSQDVSGQDVSVIKCRARSSHHCHDVRILQQL